MDGQVPMDGQVANCKVLKLVLEEQVSVDGQITGIIRVGGAVRTSLPPLPSHASFLPGRHHFCPHKDGRGHVGELELLQQAHAFIRHVHRHLIATPRVRAMLS